MKCNKCKSEIDSESKFCSNCGEKVEDSGVISTFNHGIDTARKMWFLFGFLRGSAMKGKKKDKWFEKFEKEIEIKIPEIWEEYQSTIDFWREQVKNIDKDG